MPVPFILYDTVTPYIQTTLYYLFSLQHKVSCSVTSLIDKAVAFCYPDSVLPTEVAARSGSKTYMMGGGSHWPVPSTLLFVKHGAEGDTKRPPRAGEIVLQPVQMHLMV